jgi:hypothetical protein
LEKVPDRKEAAIVPRRIAHAAQICALVITLALVPAALAAKGGGGKSGGNSGPTTSTGSINSLVLLVPTRDGLPHWDHAITFNVTSTAQYYFVRVDCYQNGALVYEKSNGFTGSWLTDYGLSGPAWTGGAADCNAVLYSQNWDGSNQQTEATMSFHVYA